MRHVLDMQAGLLAQQDSFALFIWFAVQSILNVIGDLVPTMYFKQGLVGAAWATCLITVGWHHRPGLDAQVQRPGAASH